MMNLKVGDKLTVKDGVFIDGRHLKEYTIKGFPWGNVMIDIEIKHHNKKGFKRFFLLKEHPWWTGPGPVRTEKRFYLWDFFYTPAEIRMMKLKNLRNPRGYLLR